MASRPQLFDILSESGTVPAADLERAVRLHQERGQPLSEVLVEESLLHEDDVFFILSRQLGAPPVPAERLLHLTLSPDVRRRVPPSLARRHVLVPLDLDIARGILSVAMIDPSDRVALEQLREVSRVAEIRTYLARRSAILGALQTAYSTDDEAPGTPPEPLPAPRIRPKLGTGASGNTPAPPPSEEPKVEIDPGLVEEIAALHSLPEGVGPRRRDRPVPESERVTPDSITTVVRSASKALFPAEPAAEASGELETSALLVDHPPIEEEEEEESTNPFGVTGSLPEPTTEVTVIPSGALLEEREPDASSPSGAAASATPLPDVRHMEEVDSLLKELLSSVGVLVSMLEERIDPSGGIQQEYGRVSRLVARQTGLEELEVARISLAAHLFGLDIALRRELGITGRLDVVAAFAATPGAPGGLGPSLRMLGAKALGLREPDAAEPRGVALIRLVADYLDLRAESEDLDTVAQLLRAGGGDPVIIEALVRAVEASDTKRVRIGPRTLTSP